jgi:hypothetical protein
MEDARKARAMNRKSMESDNCDDECAQHCRLKATSASGLFSTQ